MASHTDRATGLELDQCPECMGLWFDAGELRSFFSSSELKGRFLLDDFVHNLQAIGYTINTRVRRCPRCPKAGLRETSVNDIQVDVCESCAGVWLDHGELKRLVQKYQKMGLRGDARVTDQVRQGIRDQTAAGRAANSLMGALKKLFT